MFELFRDDKSNPCKTSSLMTNVKFRMSNIVLFLSNLMSNHHMQIEHLNIHEYCPFRLTRRNFVKPIIVITYDLFQMLTLSNIIDDTDVDDSDNTEFAPMKKSIFLMKNILFFGISVILLITMIIIVSVIKNLSIQSLLLIIFSIISIVIVMGIQFRKCWIEIKKINNKTKQLMDKNLLKWIVQTVSISLTIVTVLFFSILMSSLNLGYGSFISFVLFVIYLLSIIWLLTLIIYILINGINFLWIKSSSIRNKLSYDTVSFYLGSFLICPFILLITGLISSSSSIAFGLGITLSLSYTLFIGGITSIIFYRPKFLKMVFNCLLSLIGFIGIFCIYWFYFSDGSTIKINVITPLERFPNNLTMDPSLNGNYSYSSLTYGSGFDKRIEYGKEVSIKMPTIDLSSLIKLSEFNRKTFGFNESSLPLNGRIWYPTNRTGPYPLVVLLHGNHISTESSEVGYEYLGEMLASQGFISVSLDQNFMNIGPFYSSTEHGRISKIRHLGFTGGAEFVVRAILLLETLKQFQIWNLDITNVFYNQFDLSNIGLMGHSVAGESITIAYLINQLKYFPEFPSDLSFSDYNFGIKVLFSISGTTDAYMPLGRSLHLTNVNMFAIHGMHDGDLSTFLAQSKLTNLKFVSNDSYYFKSSLYVHQANHGQFSTIWGRYDLISGANRFLNIRPVMKFEEQKHLCKIYMSALMQLVLKHERKYRILFEDYRSGLNYLPRTNYISTYQDSNEIVIADFENYDVTIGTMDGSRINTTNLSLWSSIYFKVYQSSMLVLQTIKDSIGKYSIHLQHSINGSALRFMIGRTDNELVDYLTVSIFYEDETNELFPIRVLPALKKKVFKFISEEDVIAVQTISLPLISPIIGLEFILNVTDAQFIIDNIVLVK